MSADETAIEPVYLTVAEVAAILKVEEETIRRWVASGKLPARQFGRRHLIAARDVMP